VEELNGVNSGKDFMIRGKTRIGKEYTFSFGDRLPKMVYISRGLDKRIIVKFTLNACDDKLIRSVVVEKRIGENAFGEGCWMSSSKEDPKRDCHISQEWAEEFVTMMGIPPVIYLDEEEENTY